MNRHGCLGAAAAVGAAALLAVSLSGCTTQPLPAGPTGNDITGFYAAVADARWNSMGFGPDVERPSSPTCSSFRVSSGRAGSPPA